MSYEIIKKCGTNCLIKSDEPHRIIGTVNDEIASILTDALEAKMLLIEINRSAEFKQIMKNKRYKIKGLE